MKSKLPLSIHKRRARTYATLVLDRKEGAYHIIKWNGRFQSTNVSIQQTGYRQVLTISRLKPPVSFVDVTCVYLLFWLFEFHLDVAVKWPNKKSHSSHRYQSRGPTSPEWREEEGEDVVTEVGWVSWVLVAWCTFLCPCLDLVQAMVVRITEAATAAGMSFFMWAAKI